MFLHRIPVILLAASSAWGQSDSVPSVRVFLFAGQSNMVGADTKPEIVDDYPPFVGSMQPQGDVRYAYSVGRSASEGWTHLQAVDDDFGPELTFARRVNGRVDGPIAILKCAVGGTTIAKDWNPDSPQEGQQLFQRLVALVRQNLDALGREGVAHQVEALFWHQGENDMLSRELNPLYEAGLKYFVARVREELELPDLRIFVGEVSDKGIWGMDFRRPMRELRAQQRRVIEADPRMWWVPTSHLAFEVMGSGQPHYHFGTQGQLQHGEAYAQAYLAVTGATPARAPREAPTIPERGTRVHVFLLAGQRNMEGEDSFVDQLPARWRETQPNVLMRCSLGGGAYRSTTWEALRPVGHLGNFGPELSFGHALDDALDEPLAILKFTDSAAQLSDWAPGCEDASRPRYERLLAFMRESLADLESRGLRPSLDGVIWHHGENETWYAPFRKRYAALLEELITSLRRDLGNPDLTWILAEQSTRAPWGEERITEMNASLELLAAADPHVHLVPTSDLPHGRIHFGTQGSLRLGERLAQAWLTAAPQTAQDGFHYEPATFLDMHEERSAGVTLGDVDGDGDLDIVIANGRHWPGQNRTFVNNGKSEFTLSRDLGTDRATSYAAPMADLDGDGDLDIAVGNDDAPSRVFWNDGHGRFGAGPTIGAPANTRSLNLADLDGDGAIDIIVANRRQQNSIFFGDDSHRFERHERFGASDGSTIVVAVGDLDGDGHIDLVEANRDGQPNFLYLNDGQGHFDTPIAYGTASDQTVAVALGDLDDDGHLDVLNANSEQSNAIYFGDGAGHFERSVSFGPPGDLSYGLAVLDLDGDGDLDVVVANRGQRNGIYLNSGAGSSFREIRFGEPQALTYGVAAADLDGDGVPEIVTANSDGRNWLYRRVPGPE